MKTSLLFFLSFIPLYSVAQSPILSQDFSSSNVVSDYISSTPNSGQFNKLKVEPRLYLPDPDNSNRIDGRFGSADIQIFGGKTQMNLKSAWCVYRSSGGFYSINAEPSVGSISRDLNGATAFTVEFDFSKSYDLAQYVIPQDSFLDVGPFGINIASTGQTFSINGNTFSGEQKIFVVYNYSSSSVTYNHFGYQTAAAATAYIFVDEALIESQPLYPDYIPSQTSITVTSDDYYFTEEPYYAPGNPTMGTYTVTFDNFKINNISPFSTAITPSTYAYTSGILYATSTLNNRNVYTKEVDSPTIPGKKEIVKIYFDGTQWIWELAPSTSSGRTMTTTLATNTSQSMPNAPCAGWTNGFSLEGGGCNSSSLPVTLTKFSAEMLENRSCLLRWTTTTETNSSCFEIEHSTNAKHWRKLGEVTAKVESNLLANYHYTHNNPSSSRNYYRLKQIDQDGTFAYSRIVSANLDDTSKAPLLYPNPVSERLFIQDISNPVKVEIRNLLGQTVLKSSQNLAEGISLETVANGMYLVKVTDTKGETRTERLVVQR